MNSLIPIKLSLSEFSPTDCALDDLNLQITFNHASTFFKPPFASLSLQLVNFPMISILYLKFLNKSQVVFESVASIQDLHTNKSIEQLVILTSPDDQDNSEKPRQLERKNSIRSLGTVKIYIEKEDTEVKHCQLCPVFENFSTVSERALEIIVEVNKNSQHPYTRIEELSMEIHELYQNKEITQERVKNIRCLLIGVNEKLKLLELYKERYEQVIFQIEEEQKSRENMQVSFKSACNDFLISKTALENQVLTLDRKIKSLSEKNLKLENIEKVFNDFKTTKELEVQMLKAKILELSKNSTPHSITQEIVETLQKNSSFKENASKMQKNEFDKVTQGYEAILAQYQESLSDLTHENLSLTQAIDKLTKTNNEIISQNEYLARENFAFKSRLLECEKRLTYVKELEDQMTQHADQANQVKADYEVLKEQMEKVSKRYHEGTRGLFNDKKNLMETNKKLTDENSKLKEQINLLHNRYNELQSKAKDGSLGSEAGTFTFLNSQNIKLLKDIKDLCEVSNRIESEMLKEFSLVIKTIVEVSGKYLMLQRLQSRILMVLKDKDLENNILRDLISKVQKGRPVYVPVRGDFVDNQLANFLNSSEKIIEVPFVRLEPGVYLFGTKRVVLRVEQIGIVIRVGGGFLKLEDFIENQTGVEIIKMRDKDLKDFRDAIDWNEEKDLKSFEEVKQVKESYEKSQKLQRYEKIDIKDSMNSRNSVESSFKTIESPESRHPRFSFGPDSLLTSPRSNHNTSIEVTRMTSPNSAKLKIDSKFSSPKVSIDKGRFSIGTAKTVTLAKPQVKKEIIKKTGVRRV